MNQQEVLKASAVSADEAKKLIGEWRRFGKYGPRYEVLAVLSGTEAKIRVHTSGEITKYSIAEILNDPVD